MKAKTQKSKKKKDWGKLGQCQHINKTGKRCQHKATRIDGSRKVCEHHWMTEPVVSKYTKDVKFKGYHLKGV